MGFRVSWGNTPDSLKKGLLGTFVDINDLQTLYENHLLEGDNPRGELSSFQDIVPAGTARNRAVNLICDDAGVGGSGYELELLLAALSHCPHTKLIKAAQSAKLEGHIGGRNDKWLATKLSSLYEDDIMFPAIGWMRILLKELQTAGLFPMAGMVRANANGPSLEAFDLKGQISAFSERWDKDQKLIVCTISDSKEKFRNHLMKRLRARMSWNNPTKFDESPIDLENIDIDEAVDLLEEKLARSCTEHLLLPVHVSAVDGEAAHEFWQQANAISANMLNRLVLCYYGKSLPAFPNSLSALELNPCFEKEHFDQWLARYIDNDDRFERLSSCRSDWRRHFHAYCFPDDKANIRRIYDHLETFSQCFDGQGWHADKLCSELKTFRESKNYVVN